MFETTIGIMEGQTDNTRKICETIKSRDPTFKYSITEPGREYLLELYSGNIRISIL